MAASATLPSRWSTNQMVIVIHGWYDHGWLTTKNYIARQNQMVSPRRTNEWFLGRYLFVFLFVFLAFMAFGFSCFCLLSRGWLLLTSSWVASSFLWLLVLLYSGIVWVLGFGGFVLGSYFFVAFTVSSCREDGCSIQMTAIFALRPCIGLGCQQQKYQKQQRQQTKNNKKKSATNNNRNTQED